MSPLTRDADGVVTGNTYDKYGSGNPVVRRLVRRFEASLDELLELADPQSILDVGCGEGILTRRWAARRPDRRVVGVDLEDPALRAAWAAAGPLANLELRAMRADALAFGDDAFDLVTAIEVLEHLPDPEAALAEMTRVARHGLLVSVPREPLWRALNVARGAYVKDLGNTPGHLNHWSKRSFVELLSRHGEVVEARSPFPWTMLLVRVA